MHDIFSNNHILFTNEMNAKVLFFYYSLLAHFVILTFTFAA